MDILINAIRKEAQKLRDTAYTLRTQALDLERLAQNLYVEQLPPDEVERLLQVYGVSETPKKKTKDDLN